MTIPFFPSLNVAFFPLRLWPIPAISNFSLQVVRLGELNTHGAAVTVETLNNLYICIIFLGKLQQQHLQRIFWRIQLFGFFSRRFFVMWKITVHSFLMRLAFTGENGHHRSKKQVVKCQWISFFRWTHFLEPEHGFAKKSEWLRLDLRLFGGWKKTTNIPPNGGLTVIYDGRK